MWQQRISVYRGYLESPSYCILTFPDHNSAYRSESVWATLHISVTLCVLDMVVMRCVSAVLEWSGYHKHGKEEVSSEGLVYGEVLMGQPLFVTSVEAALTVGLVRRHSRSKDVYLVVLLGVPNIHHLMIGTSKWWVIHLLTRLSLCSYCFCEVGHPVYACYHTTLWEAEWGFGLLSSWPLYRWRWVVASLVGAGWLEY